MSWFARLLLGAPRKPEEVDVYIDVVAPSLAGFSRGAARAKLERRFGPPTDFWARSRGMLSYPHLGLQISLAGRGGGLEGFIVFTKADAMPFGGWLAFPGYWNPGSLRRAPDERRLVELLGEPTGREVDEEEVMLHWERPPLYIIADFDVKDGEMTDFAVDFQV